MAITRRVIHVLKSLRGALVPALLLLAWEISSHRDAVHAYAFVPLEQVWSALVLTSWKNEPQISCRSCGRKQQVLSLVISLVAGWWGFPWGLIMTPVQVIRNLRGIFGGPDPLQPSPQLEQAVRVSIARQALAARQVS